MPGDILRQAQEQAIAGQPGAARTCAGGTAERRAVITQLVQRPETLLIRAKHAASDQALARLAATLQAAASGEEAVREALAQDGC